MIKDAIAKLAITMVCSGLSLKVQAQESPPFIPQTPETLAQQVEVQEYLNLINLAQLDYFLNHSKFPTTLSDLNLTKLEQTENYNFQLLPSENPSQGMIIIAQAKKPQLKSYSGAVFIFSLGESMTGISGICETNLPSMFPPFIPVAPNFASTGVLCPTGSHALTDFDRDKLL